MKKYLLAIGLVAFLMTSCCDKKEDKGNAEKSCCKDKQEQCYKHHECDHHEMPGMPGMCPKMMACMDGLVNALANWEDLDEEQRAEAIEMAKKVVEHKEAMKAEMEKCGQKPECCKEKHEGCQKHEGKCEKHEGECKNHEGCKHEGGCKHEEGKKCEGNHEGCQHQHEGCKHDKK